MRAFLREAFAHAFGYLIAGATVTMGSSVVALFKGVPWPMVLGIALIVLGFLGALATAIARDDLHIPHFFRKRPKTTIGPTLESVYQMAADNQGRITEIEKYVESLQRHKAESALGAFDAFEQELNRLTGNLAGLQKDFKWFVGDPLITNNMEVVNKVQRNAEELERLGLAIEQLQKEVNPHADQNRYSPDQIEVPCPTPQGCPAYSERG